MTQNKVAHILVVDDVQSIRLAVCEHLSREFKVSATSGAAEAMEMCARVKIDLLITDIKMPGMSGIQLIHTLRKQYPRMQFALMTAYNVDDYVRIARNEGIYHIIPKSVFMDLGFFLNACAQVDQRRLFRHRTLLSKYQAKRITSF